MPIVYCQLFSEEKLLADRLLVSIEQQVSPQQKAVRGGTFRVPEDQVKAIQPNQEMRLEFPEKVARRLNIAEGNSLHIVAHRIHAHIAQFGEAVAAPR